MNQRIYVNSSEFKPSEGYMLVKPIEFKKEETSASGIVISIRKESVAERPSYGTVVEISDSSAKEHLEININSIVFWPSTDGIDLEFDDGVFLLLRDKSVIGFKK